MAPTKLKIKGNKAFSMLSAIESEGELSKTWRLVTKVKDALEYGKRLENLSWRLWFMHHLMVHDQKTQNKFKKFSAATTRKLETEKATDLAKLTAPNYRPRGPESSDKKTKKKATTKKGSPQAANKKSTNLTKNTDSLAQPGNISSPPNPLTNDDAVLSIEYKSEDQTVASTGSNGKDDGIMIDASTIDQSAVINNDSFQVEDNMAIVDGGMTRDSMLDANDETDISNNSAMDDLLGDISLHQEYVLRQYTADQDPYQVIRLPGTFVGFDASAIFHHDRAPIMELDMDQIFRLRGFYPSSPDDSSEPNSPPEMDWFANNTMMQADGVGQQPASGIQSNLSYHMASSAVGDQLVGQTNSGIHGAVYVRNSPSNSALNGSLISTLSPALNQSDLSGQNLIGNVSNRNIMYVNHQYSGDPTSTSDAIVVSQAGNTTSSQQPNRQPTSEGRPKKTHTGGEQQCCNCGVTSTPLWRRSANDELLCNACGLYLKLHKMSRPKTMKPHIVRKDARDDETAQPVCSNCGTMTTPLWRRDEEGQTLCNACGLYFKLHHEKRPLSMKTDVIKKRQRYENGQNPNRRSSKKQRSIDDGPQQDQSSHQSYGPISVSPTASSMTIPTTTSNSIAVPGTSTLSLSVPPSLGHLSIVDQDMNSPISMPPTPTTMSTSDPSRSLHGSFM